MGFSQFSTKPLSLLLPKILIAAKGKPQEYCEQVYARGSINQMWILLKNSKELLENLKSEKFTNINSVKTLFYTYYNHPHDKLKCCLFDIIDSCAFL